MLDPKATPLGGTDLVAYHLRLTLQFGLLCTQGQHFERHVHSEQDNLGH